MRSLALFLLLLCSILVQAQNSIGGATQINKTFYVDGTTYTLETAYQACVAQGSGTIVLAPGYTETLTAAINLNGACRIQLPESGSLTIPAGKEWSCTSSCDDITIEGRTTPYRTPGVSGGIGFLISCSPGANVSCINIDGSRTANGFAGIKLRGFFLQTVNGNKAGIGITLKQITAYDLDLRGFSIAGQIGILLDGAGSYTGSHRWSYVNWTYSGSGTTNCLQLQGNANVNFFTGGCPGVNIISGNGNQFLWDAENTTSAFTLANSSNNFGNYFYIYGQGNTADVTFGATACGNYVANIGATSQTQIKVIDPGACNDIWNPFTHHFDASGNLMTLGMINLGNNSTTYPAGTGPLTVVTSLNGGIDLEEAGGGTDSKWWEFWLGNTSLTFRTLNDARKAASPFFTLNRSGATASNTTFNAPIVVGNNGSTISLKQRIQNASTGKIRAATRKEVLMSWPKTMTDTNYTVACSVQDSTTAAGTQGLTFERILTKSATHVGLVINNPTTSTITGSIDCIGEHQ